MMISLRDTSRYEIIIASCGWVRLGAVVCGCVWLCVVVCGCVQLCAVLCGQYKGILNSWN